MSPTSTPTPRRHRYGWWIAGAVSAILAGSVIFVAVRYNDSIQWGYRFAYGWATGNPVISGCTATDVHEATAGQLWYRIINMRCINNGSVNVVYANRQGRWALPTFMSINGPAADLVRETPNNGFEIVLTKPLADGSTTVPIRYNIFGDIDEVKTFNQGRPLETSSQSRRE